MSKKLLKSTFVVGAMTFASRVTGLIRDIAFAQFLGTGLFADAFFVAFRIPNFLRRIFGEGAFSVAFVPVFSEYVHKKDRNDARAFLDLMAGRLGLILLSLTGAGIVLAPLLVAVVAPGFISDTAKFNATIEALRFTFPYLFFIAFVAMAGGILNTCHRFAIPALTPVLLNLCLIAAVYLLVPRMDNAARALALGVLIAGAAQLLLQLPFLRKEGFLPRPRFRPDDSADGRDREGVSRVFKLMLPALFGVSVAQINLLINTLLASFLITGSVSWLYYSDRLMEFPLGVFGIALGTVILPSLSATHAAKSGEEFSATLNWAVRWVFLISVPAAVALAVLAFPLVATIFHYGAFGDNDVRMASRSLVAFSAGLVAFVLVKVLAPGFYARQNTRTPVRAGVIAMIVNALASLALVLPMAHVGLALATSIAGFVNSAVLFLELRKENIFRPETGWVSYLVRVVVAAAIMGGVIGYGTFDPSWWLDATLWPRVGRLTIWIGAGLVTYFGVLFLLGVRMHQLLGRPAKT